MSPHLAHFIWFPLNPAFFKKWNLLKGIEPDPLACEALDCHGIPSYGQFLMKLNMHSPYDPEIPLLRDLPWSFSEPPLACLQNGNLRWPSGKESTCQCRRCKTCGFDPWVGKIPGKGNRNRLQFSWLENPVERGAWWGIIQGVTKSRTQLSDQDQKQHRITEHPVENICRSF